MSISEQLSSLCRVLSGSAGIGTVRSAESLQQAINLMKLTPCTRNAVLAYIKEALDYAVNNYLTAEVKPQGDETLDTVYSELGKLLKENPSTWTDVLSSWSLELLGELSQKYNALATSSARDVNSMHDCLVQWAQCLPMQGLLKLATDSFSLLDSPTVAVRTLMSTSQRYMTTFDWVVAHVGSCFPEAVLYTVLEQGRSYYFRSGGKIDTLQSVVNILQHLSAIHRTALTHAVESMLKEEKEEAESRFTVPFFCQLCLLSSSMLHATAPSFHCMFGVKNTEVLNRLHNVATKEWWARPNLTQIDFLRTICQLVRLSGHGPETILFLIDVALSPDATLDQGVKDRFTKVLDVVVSDMFQAAHQASEPGAQMPLVDSVLDRSQLLMHRLQTDPNPRCQSWLVRVLCCSVCLRDASNVGSSLLQQLLINSQSDDNNAASQLITMAQAVNILKPNLLQSALTVVLSDAAKGLLTNEQLLAMLRRLNAASKWDAEQSNILRAGFRLALTSCMPELLCLMTHATPQTVRLVLPLIASAGQEDSTLSGLELQAARAMLVYFCLNLDVTSLAAPSRWMRPLLSCLQGFKRSSLFTNSLLRLLLETAVSLPWCELFGGEAPIETSAVGTLLEQNRKLMSLSSGLLRSSRFSTFKGRTAARSNTNEQRSAVAREMLVSVIEELCTDDNSDRKSFDSSRLAVAAKILSDLLSPDVLYTSLDWPESDIIRLTVERDVRITRRLEQHPVLWRVLQLCMSADDNTCCGVPTPAARQLCSVVRSLFSQCIRAHDTARSVVLSNSTRLAVKLLQLMHQGGFVAPPLAHCWEAFGVLQPYEIHSCLMSVWNYMKNTPVSTRKEAKDVACKAEHLVAVRHVLQKNIGSTAHLYARLCRLNS